MLRTFGSDLTSLINSDPAWKVSKGSKSSSRRARKTTAGNLKYCKEQGCRRSEKLTMPVSEPEKHGVVSLGCRFSHKAEHMPIKKRRFMFRSPSPPPDTASPPVEETGLLTESREVSNSSPALKTSSGCQKIDTNISIGVKKLENSDRKFAGEDFSGISILAAAACSSNLGTSSKDLRGDLRSSSELSSAGISSCIFTEPVGELASNSRIINFPLEAVAVADGIDVKHASSGAESATSPENVSCRKDEEIGGSQRLSSLNERFHWDLNVVMDAWEDSVDDPGSHNDARYNISRDATKNHDDSYDKLAVAYADKTNLMLDKSEVLLNQAPEGSKPTHDIGVCHSANSISLVENCVVSSTNSDVRKVKYKVEDTKCTKVQTVSGFAITGSDHTNQPSVVEVCNASMTKHHRDQQNLEGFNSTAVLPSSQVNNNTASVVICDTLIAGAHNCEREGELICNSAVNTDFSEIPFGLPKESCDPPLDEISKANLDNCLNYSDPNKSAELAELKEAVGVRYHTASVAGVVAACDLQDYDSQYEDGELRESNEHVWEKYNEVNREGEHVDCRPNNIETHVVNTSDHPDSEFGLVDMSENRKQRIEVASSVDLNVCNEAKVVGDYGGQDQDNGIAVDGSALENMDLLSGTEQRAKSRSSSDMSIDDDVNNVTSAMVYSKTAETTEEPKPLRRALQSCVERPISRDGYFRDERRDRTDIRLEPGSMRSFERGRYSFHNQDRGRHGGNWDRSSDYRRGFKCQFSPMIYGRLKPNDDTLHERENFRCDGSQDDLSYAHHLQPNCQATDDKEPLLHPRHKHDKKYSPDRGEGFGRGRTFRYGFAVESREGRGGYNGPSPEESFQSSLKYRRPLSRRERSLSPFGARGQSNINHNRGKSPSRSRSRSPVTWNPSRGRLGGVNTFNRHRSRSPNFRSDIRTQRLRSPNEQTGFGPDQAARFRPMARTYSSPPRNRWNSGRQDDLGHFREFGYKQKATVLDRSPGRIRLTGDRDSFIDSPRNRKSDGYSRISDRTCEAGTGRGFRYAENYDHRRKHYSFLRPARRSYEDGVANILHRESDDGFPVRNYTRDRDAPSIRGRGRFRSFDSRIGEMPRRFRGELHTFLNEQDGKFSSNSKQFGDEVMNSSRNLKSEEHCRRTHMGRYTETEGANRGHRYDNYEDRRKQYDSINLMRCSDNEGTKERSNHDAEEYSQDAPDSCTLGTNGFKGHDGAILTRKGEDGGPSTCGQVDTPGANSQLVGVQSSDNDATKAHVECLNERSFSFR